MTSSRSKAYLAGLLLCFLLIVVATLRVATMREPPVRSTQQAPVQAKNLPKVRVRHIEKSRDNTYAAKPDRTIHTTSVTTQPLLNETGILFVLDDFRSRAAFPSGYKISGVVLTGDGLTLNVPDTPGNSRIGMVESPPLPLNLRAHPASESLHRELPDGHGVDLEISLSAEGTTWSDWYLINRTSGSDSDSGLPSAPPPADDPEANAKDPVDKPAFIRYRLTLTATGDEALLLKNVEIWQRKSKTQNSDSVTALQRTDGIPSETVHYIDGTKAADPTTPLHEH